VYEAIQQKQRSVFQVSSLTLQITFLNQSTSQTHEAERLNRRQPYAPKRYWQFGQDTFPAPLQGTHVPLNPVPLPVSHFFAPNKCLTVARSLDLFASITDGICAFARTIAKGAAQFSRVVASVAGRSHCCLPRGLSVSVLVLYYCCSAKAYGFWGWWSLRRYSVTEWTKGRKLMAVVGSRDGHNQFNSQLGSNALIT